MYEAIGVKNIDQFYHHLQQPQPMDPSRKYYALSGKPFQAFPGQDHRAHITAHLNFMSTNMVRNNPAVMAALQKNILEHISLMAQEQVQLEFREELQQISNDATTSSNASTKDPNVQQQMMLTRVQQVLNLEKLC